MYKAPASLLVKVSLFIFFFPVIQLAGQQPTGTEAELSSTSVTELLQPPTADLEFLLGGTWKGSNANFNVEILYQKSLGGSMLNAHLKFISKEGKVLGERESIFWWDSASKAYRFIDMDVSNHSYMEGLAWREGDTFKYKEFLKGKDGPFFLSQFTIQSQDQIRLDFIKESDGSKSKRPSTTFRKSLPVTTEESP